MQAAVGEWRCRACDDVAGSICIEHAHLVRITFTGRMYQPLTEAAVASLAPLLEARDAAGLYARDLELVPFYCPRCDATYCGAHWQWWDEFDDENLPGWHDSIRGRCPQGHERMLED